MKELILTDGQTGYDVVSKYIADYWIKNYYSEVIVSLEISYDGEIFYKFNETAYPNNTGIEFLDDWWEGQKYIKILGIISVDKVEPVKYKDWISTKDSLPKENDTVLVLVNGKPRKNITLVDAYFLAQYIREEGWVIDGHEYWSEGFEVTYWRELPELPEKEQKNEDN